LKGLLIMTRAFSRMRLALVPALVALSGCGINSVPTAEENAKAKWANVQADYQRRADLIPNLVETVKGYAKQEQAVLVQVTQARAQATTINLTTGDLTDPAKVQRFQQAQGQLSAGLGRLLATTEAYPQLRSNENFLALQSQLEGTENRINISIKDYNEAVQAYNTTIRTFPSVVGAKLIYGAQPMQPYKAVSPNADQAPKVKF